MTQREKYHDALFWIWLTRSTIFTLACAFASYSPAQSLLRDFMPPLGACAVLCVIWAILHRQFETQCTDSDDCGDNHAKL